MCCCSVCSWLVPFNPARAMMSRFLGHRAFCIYKCTAAVYCVFWCVFWPVGEDVLDGWKFVTHWTFYVAAIYFVVSSTTACGLLGVVATPRMSTGPQRARHAVDPDVLGLTPWGGWVMWLQIFTWNIACVSSLVVVLIFWGVLYNGRTLDSVDVNAHVLIAIIMFIDQLLVATEYKCEQLWASELFGVLYLTFNIIFYFRASKDERLIYEILDWGDDLGVAVLYSAVILIVLVPVFAGVHLCVYKLREKIYSSCYNADYTGEDTVKVEEGLSRLDNRRLRRSF